jgi:hypothetical protein
VMIVFCFIYEVYPISLGVYCPPVQAMNNQWHYVETPFPSDNVSEYIKCSGTLWCMREHSEMFVFTWAKWVLRPSWYIQRAKWSLHHLHADSLPEIILSWRHKVVQDAARSI